MDIWSSGTLAWKRDDWFCHRCLYRSGDFGLDYPLDKESLTPPRMAYRLDWIAGILVLHKPSPGAGLTRALISPPLTNARMRALLSTYSLTQVVALKGIRRVSLRNSNNYELSTAPDDSLP